MHICTTASSSVMQFCTTERTVTCIIARMFDTLHADLLDSTQLCAHS